MSSMVALLGVASTPTDALADVFLRDVDEDG